MLATPGALPDGPDWIFEVRWDGVRVLADVLDGRLRLTTSAQVDVTGAFPELFDVERLAPDVLLDGVVVSLADGVPRASALVRRMQRPFDPASVPAHPVTFMVFDVLRLYGVSLVDRPLGERRATLERLSFHPSEPSAVALSPVYTDGPALLAATAQRRMVGLVAKRRDSVYRSGCRSEGWIVVSP
ncbi:MAG: hypothetical protein ACRDRK_13410 [Pseudonocardia sp.]